jgi:hypothetical protein
MISPPPQLYAIDVDNQEFECDTIGWNKSRYLSVRLNRFHNRNDPQLIPNFSFVIDLKGTRYHGSTLIA